MLNSMQPLASTKPATLKITAKDGVETVRFEANGDIYIKGRLVTNDLEIVEGFRELILGMKN